MNQIHLNVLIGIGDNDQGYVGNNSLKWGNYILGNTETIDPYFGFSRYAESLGRSANSFELSTSFAPLFAKLSVRFFSKSLTVKSNLFLNKLFASFPPTFPSPIKPILIITSLILMNIKNLMLYFFFKNVFNKNRTKI